MADRSGSSVRNPIPVLSQSSRQPSQTPQPPPSQAYQHAEATLARTGNVSVAISNMLGSQTPQVLPDRGSASKAPVPPKPKDLPAPMKLQDKPDPEDPIQTKHQLTMLNAFRAWGRCGLTLVVLKIADELKNQAKSWTFLTEDAKQGTKYIQQLLMLLPDYIIESLIKNSLPYDYVNNKEVRSFVDTYMSISTPYPGVYANIVTRATNTIGYKAVQPSVLGQTGRWLTSNEVKRLLERVEKYLLNDENDETENAAIDDFGRSVVGPARSKSDPKFKGSVDRLDEWRAAIRKQYCTNIDPSKADTGFIRCPFEVGYSDNIPRRCKSHKVNQSTTPIFGIVNAITHLPKTQGGFEFPDVWQLALFPIWVRSPELAQVAEVLGSVLCSSYWCWGGMNIVEAGYSTLRENTAPQYSDQLWTDALRATNRRLQDFKVIDADLKCAKDNRSKLALLEGLNDLEKTVDEAQAQLDEVSANLAKAKERKAAKIAECEKLEARVEAQRKINETKRGQTSTELQSMVEEFETALGDRPVKKAQAATSREARRKRLHDKVRARREAAEGQEDQGSIDPMEE